MRSRGIIQPGHHVHDRYVGQPMSPASQNPIGFAGLKSPKWPAQLFPGDDAWKIDPARVEKGRAVYAEICVECHLGPVDDPAFDKKYPEKSFWSSKRWNAAKGVVDLVQQDVAGMGTDPAQSEVLWKRQVDVPGRDLRRASEDCRLSFHHARTKPRRGPRR